MGEWGKLKFKELFEAPLRNGLTKPQRIRGSGLPFVNMKEIFKYDVIIDETPMELAPVTSKEIQNSLLKYGDLLFARQSLVEEGAGKVSIYKGKFPTVFESHLIRCRIDSKRASPDFIYYLFKSPMGRATVGTITSQTAAAGIRGSDLQNLEFIFPPLPEQKAIASVLSSLDDKIDLLHRQNKTLEAMAETLFRQWFVEEAREDWEELALGKIVKIAIGRTPPRKQFHWFSKHSSNIKWISIKDMGQPGVFIFDTSEYLTQEAVESFNIPVIPPDTVLLSFKMTVGRVGITTEPMLSNEAIAHFIFDKNTPFTKEYLYLFLKAFAYDTLGSTSSIVSAINSSMIKEMKITIPHKKIMDDFRLQTEPLFSKIKQNKSQIHTLENLRDTLLPKLMSGEVRVEYEN